MIISMFVGRFGNLYFLRFLIDTHPLDMCGSGGIQYLGSLESNIKEQMRVRDYHKKKAVQFNSQFHWDKYRETRSKLNSSMRTTKRNLFL